MVSLARSHLVGPVVVGMIIFAGLLLVESRGTIPRELETTPSPLPMSASPNDNRPAIGGGERMVPTAPLYRGLPVSQLDGDPKAIAQVPDRYQEAKAELARIAVALAENSRQPPLWMRVAYLKHFFGDEPGAADAYEYLNAIAPGDPIPFYNLAAIYGYYLKRPEKAIPKYRAAIELDPATAEYYYGFGNFWREVMQEPAAAEATFLQGLSRVPDFPPLLTALGSLYAEMGEIAKAIASYERAFSHPSLGSGERAAIEAEVERLKQRLSP